MSAGTVYANGYGTPTQHHAHAVTGISGDGMTASFGYDNNGNMTTRTVNGVTYAQAFDVENRLTSVTVNGQVTSFHYDADDNRILTVQPNGTKVYTPFPEYEKTVPPTGPSTERIHYSLAGQYIATRVKVAGQTGAFYFIFTDRQGSITNMRKGDGSWVNGNYARYDAFGGYRTTPGASVNPGISDHGFTGHRHNNTGENDLGLIYMNARYYLPEIGRFISPDTIVPEPRNPQSFNRYAYVRNNPMNFTDPSGHAEIGANQGDRLPHEPQPPKPKFIPKNPPFTNLPVNPANIDADYSMQGFGDSTYAHNNREAYSVLGHLHSGWDIPMSIGTSLVSLGTGTVVCVGFTCGLTPKSGGQGIAIRYDSCACVVFYLHLSSVTEGLVKDSEVTPGMEVGLSGESVSGYAHLHIEIRPQRESLIFYNPLYFFTSQALNTMSNSFTDYEDGSNQWRIYGYSSVGGGSYWDNTLPALWVQH